MKVTLYTQTGETNGELELPKEIFEAKFNKDLIHQALVRQLANKRASSAHVKTRGEVSGGGRKPFRQKGTGNARQGTIRAPQMRGGGSVFGPTNEKNYSKDMPKKQRRAALFSALSVKAKDGDVVALESYVNKDMKTKDFVAMLKKLPIKRDVLVVISWKNEDVQKSSNNIPFVKTILVNYVNIHDLQKYDTVLFLKEAVEKMKEIFLKK